MTDVVIASASEAIQLISAAPDYFVASAPRNDRIATRIISDEG